MSFILFLLLHFLFLFWICIDGSTCIHPQRTPKKLKFWKFYAIQGTGCIDAARAAFLRFGDTECVPHSTRWHCCHCVAVSYLSVLEPQSSSLWSLPPSQVVKCVLSTTGFHWMLSVTGGEMAACQSQLVYIKLIYTFRIISYD